MLFCAQSEIADNQRPLAPAGLQYVLARLLYQKSERNANGIKPGDIFFPSGLLILHLIVSRKSIDVEV